ncbi:MAG: hypothetical protein KJO40_13565 [Deltaproteobacteria bacterium]|nr:hypothetical protein [Deltaproteobacteria bacterium]
MAYYPTGAEEDDEVVEMPPDIIRRQPKQAKQAVMPFTFLLMGAIGVWFFFFEPKARRVRARTKGRRR